MPRNQMSPRSEARSGHPAWAWHDLCCSMEGLWSRLGLAPLRGLRRMQSQTKPETREVTMIQHRLTLLGGKKGELRVSADTLCDALAALTDGARQATRFAVDGKSSRKGPRPAWLEKVGRIEITGLRAGSAVMDLEAPSLGEAAPDKFGDSQQGRLFEEVDNSIAQRSSVDIFAQVLSAALEDHTDELLADRSLLATCIRFAEAAGTAFRGLQLDGLTGPRKTVTVTREDVARFERLYAGTPQPHAVRVCGQLDTISASSSHVLLTLPDRTKIPALLEDHDAATLKKLFGTQVAVSGMARFRPSGKLLLIDVESLSPARDADDLFCALPEAHATEPLAPLVDQDQTSGVSAFFGTWPGEETEDDLLQSLRELG